MTERTNEAGFHWPDENPDREAREAALPEHEHDTNTSVGAGVTSAGGTATETATSARPMGADGTKRDDFPDDGVDPDLGLINEEDQPVLDEPGRLQMGGRSG